MILDDLYSIHHILRCAEGGDYQLKLDAVLIYSPGIYTDYVQPLAFSIQFFERGYESVDEQEMEEYAINFDL